VTAARPARLIATAGGVGALPWMPGTWASLATVFVAWIAAGYWGPLALVAAAVAAFVAGLWAAGAVVAASGEADPGSIVIDEVAGQLAVLATVPVDYVHYAAAFVAFRIADITKPWPASWADRSLKGGFGVMVDDLIAAVYAGLAVYLLDLAVS
jgi:phosphatidylglycerophosphatase A